MQYDYSRVPQEMKGTRRWVLWKKAERDGRTTKIPVDAQTGMGAKSNDPNTWVTFQEAQEAFGRMSGMSGLGFMLGNGFFGVDIDHAKGNPELIAEFVEALPSYSEVSQSGEGLHIVCKGSLPEGPRRKGTIEMYDSARFFALTGRVYKNRDALSDCTEAIKPLYAKYLAPRDENAPSKGIYTYRAPTAPTAPIDGLSLTDTEVLEKGFSSRGGEKFSALYNGDWQNDYESQSQADLAFCSSLAFWCGKDKEQMDRIFRQSGLMRKKWDEKRGEEGTYGQITIEKAVRGCQDVYRKQAPAPKYQYGPQEERTETTEEEQPKRKYTLDDTGNAERFVDSFGKDIRYNYDNKCWVVWDGATWKRDDTQKVKKLADNLIKRMRREAVETDDEKIADALMKNVRRLASSSGKEAMLKEATHMGGIATTNADYDKDPSLINCKNGVVDLRTGQIIHHDRKYMMSKNTGVAVDMENEPTEWLKALSAIFQGKQDVVEFVHRAVGYTMSGSVREQCFFQCYGNGSNGKSVFLNTIYSALGDYSLNAQVESILTRGNSSSGNASPDIARMNGARFVRTNEPNEGARFNEGLVKQLTGGDVVTARYLYGQEFEFKPVFKLWIACNYKITVRGTDKGIWRRMRLIPFEATFEGKNADKGLESRIRKELPQVLGWAVKGCLAWQKDGLGMPEEIQKATLEYQEEMDVVKSFLKDCAVSDKNGKERAQDVFAEYREWARSGNEWGGMTQTKFGLEMSKMYKKKNISGYVYYMGLSLKSRKQPYVYNSGKIEGKEGAEEDDLPW